MSFHFSHSQKSDKGRVRKNNEDAVFSEVPESLELLNRHGALFGVADGLGGMARGEEASALAVEGMRNYFIHFSDLTSASRLLQSIQTINMKIYTLNSVLPHNQWMATTLTCSHFQGNKLTVGHVGDCRLYRVRDEKLLCLTQDHSFERNMLSKVVGTDPKLAADIYEFELEAGDIYLQCSDGLYTVVNEKDIRQTVSGFKPEEACARLVDLANQNGGPDNITAQIIRVAQERLS